MSELESIEQEINDIILTTRQDSPKAFQKAAMIVPESIDAEIIKSQVSPLFSRHSSSEKSKSSLQIISKKALTQSKNSFLKLDEEMNKNSIMVSELSHDDDNDNLLATEDN